MKLTSLLLLLGVALATATDEPLQLFANGNIKFTVSLYQELLKTSSPNFIFSPLSAEIILALTQAGAKGKTASEFSSSLDLPASQQTTQAAIKQLLPTIKQNTDNVKLLSANKLFLANGFAVEDKFQKVATEVYEASAQNVDFGNAQAAADTINGWVASQTNDKIQDLIDPSSLSDLTRLILVNALYFSGKWQYPFEKFLTKKEKFYITSTETVDVDTMHVEDSFKYYECKRNDVKYLELPYQGTDVTMLIVLPNQKDGLQKAEENLEDILQPRNLTFERVSVSLPKWKVETSIKLKPILQNLGLKKAFNAAEADFSDISTKEGLYISDVVQKAFIEVDENGTEAAAATAVLFRKRMRPVMRSRTNIFFKADHPFLFLLRKRGNALFVGRMNNI